jgi:NADH-quinone oxidoreductase subunit M
VGIVVLAVLHQQQFGSLTFEYYGLAPATGILDLNIATEGGAWWQRQGFLFAVFALAFAIKVPMFPFHTWLPDAHVEAPTPGSAVLAGVLLKLGTFGFVRYALPLFPNAALEWAPWIIGLSLVGIVYGALVAMVQSDVKKLVAYSSVSHMGFIVLGLFALNPQGVSGAVLQMVNHGVSTGALFILVGMIYERRHIREISAFGGLAHSMPVFAAFFAIATMSSIGLPGLNGFVGEFLILLGAFQHLRWAAVIATSGVILSAVYMLWAVRRVFFGPLVNEANRVLSDLNARERLVAVALVIPMVWIGVHPSTFTNPLDRAVTELIETMSKRAPELAARNAPAETTAALELEAGE